KKKEKPPVIPLSTDLHSHLLPNLDDGVDSYDESLFIIESLAEMGYKKLITTPHIMQDFYNNSVESINAKMTELRSILKEEGIDMQVEAAAEYYLDDHLMQIIDDESQELLLFGNNYMLFETSFMNQPFYLNEFIFKAKSRGINPILAHPERYAYIQSNPDLIDDLITRGVYLQLNINSITGYYSRQVRKMAERMIDNKKIHFLGSDCHNKNHLQVMQRSVNEKYYTKALRLPLLNNSL
ncbi:tyrosine-protein phosphatase, partial [Fulvivirga aurantia]|uniref:tyrosine-protein phosphatase n=1 Tax=Fulvivirga aurantia TaxID=2529383 RepID=UPI001CA3DC0E